MRYKGHDGKRGDKEVSCALKLSSLQRCQATIMMASAAIKAAGGNSQDQSEAAEKAMKGKKRKHNSQ
jgi:hypothetical protein